MRFSKSIYAVASVFFVLFGVSSAYGQVTATERFRVTIPSNLSITAPAALASLTHDESSNNQVFGAQQWNVRANRAVGATVTFSTNQAFTHTTNSSFKRDARLDLAIASSDGPALWSIINPSDQTNYAAGVPDEVAVVQARSVLPGRATFNLTVTFITGVYETLAEGDYEMVVTGTVASN
jgi:hypothetical protein